MDSMQEKEELAGKPEEEQKKTNWWLPMGIVGLLVVLTGGLAWWQTGKSHSVVKFGAIIPLTGRVSYWGDPVNKGISLAVQSIKDKDGDDAIDLVIEDSKSDPATAVTAAHKLIDTDKVSAIYSELSGPSSSVSPVALTANKPYFYSAFISNILDQNSLATKTFINHTDVCTDFASYAVENGMKKIAVIDDSNGLIPDCKKGLESRLSADQIVTFSIAAGDDFKTVLTKIKAENPDAMVVLNYEASVINILQQKIALGMTTPLLCYKQNCATKKVIDTLGKSSLEGNVYFGVTISDWFKNDYLGINNSSDNLIDPAAFSHDAIMLLYRGIKACKVDDAKCVTNHISQDRLPANQSAIENYTFDGRSLTPSVKYWKMVDSQEQAITINR